MKIFQEYMDRNAAHINKMENLCLKKKYKVFWINTNLVMKVKYGGTQMKILLNYKDHTI